jgi:hypothetical protein
MKMKRKIICIGVIGIFLLMNFTVFSAAEKITTALDEVVVPDDYPTIQEAIDAVGIYGKVRVKPGIYYENLFIDETGLTLKGDDHSNTIIDGSGSGIVISIADHTYEVNIGGFTIQNGDVGINFGTSSLSNHIIDTTIKNNGIGIETEETSFGNTIYHNNFIENTEHVDLVPDNQLFHNGYPSGGNYWDDYTGLDEKSGLNQDQPGSDGIGDTPYMVLGSETGKDEYPFIEESGWCDNLPPQKPTCNYNKDNNKLIVSAIDPDGDQVKFGVSWNNDGNVDQWTGFYNSGDEEEIDCGEHKGTAGIIAEDEHGKQSSWNSVDVNSKAKSYNILAKLLDLFPFAFPFLRALCGL